jgi:hypothetical protein
MASTAAEQRDAGPAVLIQRRLYSIGNGALQQ